MSGSNASSISSTTATRERYRLFVRATCAVVVPLEPSLTAWLGPLFAAPEPGTRMDRLRADLSHLGSDSLPSGAPGIAPAGSMVEAFGAFSRWSATS